MAINKEINKAASGKYDTHIHAWNLCGCRKASGGNGVHKHRHAHTHKHTDKTIDKHMMMPANANGNSTGLNIKD